MQRYKIYLIYTSRRDFLPSHLLIARKQHIFRRLALKKMQKSPKSAPWQCKIAQKSWKSVNFRLFLPWKSVKNHPKTPWKSVKN